MTSVLPKRATILISFTALAGSASRAAGAGSDSMPARRAAPSSGLMVPEATWLKISRLRSFTHQIRKLSLPICQVWLPKHHVRTQNKLAGVATTGVGLVADTHCPEYLDRLPDWVRYLLRRGVV